MKKPLRYASKELGTIEYTQNMTAEDCLDGDLSKQIHTTWTNNSYAYEPGTYTMTVQVSNSAGDVCAVPLEVVVTDSTDRSELNKYYPMLTEYIAYTKVGNAIDPAAYLAGVVHGNVEYGFGGAAEEIGLPRELIAIQSYVDYSVPGVYPVEYSYTDAAGISAVTKLFVVVEE